ncbi:hypothetical protein LEN26_008274 [Aphanomyces euteiches]|nr:hypothetical protein AeMF1_004132 [Aphanomyces euteiches]KAH9130712.1 hypothetical protein LEN26_008274 [Aphanomyces euteiches]
MAWPRLPESVACPRLCADEKESLIATARAMCGDTLHDALSVVETASVVKVIEHSSTKRRAQIRLTKNVHDPSFDLLFASTEILATLDKVSDFFYVDNSTKRQNYARVMDISIAKRNRLHILIERGSRPFKHASAHHYIGVDWMAYGAKNMIIDRDACFLECHDLFEYTGTSRKRRGFICVYTSVDLARFPSFQASHGLTRDHIQREGHVFLETHTRGLLDYHYIAVVPPTSCFSRSFHLSKALERQCARILNLEELWAIQRITERLATTPAIRRMSVPSSSGPCECCRKSIGLFAAKRHCRQCHGVMCAACSVKIQFHVDKANMNVHVHVCHLCFTGSHACCSLSSPARTAVSSNDRDSDASTLFAEYVKGRSALRSRTKRMWSCSE